MQMREFTLPRNNARTGLAYISNLTADFRLLSSVLCALSAGHISLVTALSLCLCQNRCTRRIIAIKK